MTRLIARSVLGIVILPGVGLGVEHHVVTTSESPSIESDAATVCVRPVLPNGEPKSQGHVTVEAPIPGHATFELADDEANWLLTMQADNIWAAPLLISQSLIEHEVPVFPAGEISGVVALADASHGLPASLKVFFQHHTSGEDTVWSEARITDKGAWSCSVPVGTRDLKVRAPGFVSEFFWDVAVGPGSSVDLGRLVLVPGSSIIGWVAAADRDDIPEGSRVTLSPATSDRSADDGSRALQSEVVPVNAKGFFAAENVHPGRYRLQARATGYAPSPPIQVNVGQRTEVELRSPLVVSPPATLEVLTFLPDPPRSQTWFASLVRIDIERAVSEIVTSTPISDGQWVRFADLIPQTYRLRIETTAGDRWLDVEIPVESPVTTRTIEIDGAEVEGTVFKGDDPVSGSVVFGGEHGHRRIHTSSDSEGRFAALLPEPGDWPVFVFSKASEVSREVAVEVPEPDEDTGIAEVEITIPTTAIFGFVVDENDEPVARAAVQVRGESKNHQGSARSDEAGEFNVQGIESGPIEIRALTRDRQSRWEPYSIREDEDVGPVDLVLEERDALRGRVVFSGRGVVGAVVRARQASGGDPLYSDWKDVTEPDGTFELKVLPSTHEVFLHVEGAGFAYRMFRTTKPDDPGDELEIELNQQGGTLVIQDDSPVVDEGLTGAPFIFVLHDGAATGVRALYAWARRNGAGLEGDTVLRVPRMDPGRYIACRGSLEQYRAAVTGMLPPGQCAEGSLGGFGGELVLSLGKP